MPDEPRGRVRRSLRKEAVFLIVAAVLASAAGAVFYLSRATTLTVAVAPEGGTEPALLRAFADALAARHKDVRLTLTTYGGVRESADALQSGKADLAVVRPDIALPDRGLTLAVLREQALLVASPQAAGIKALSDLAGKRLGFLAPRGSDRALIESVLAHHGLDAVAAAQPPQGGVGLTGIEERDLEAALREGRVDAVAMLTTPTTPAARRIVGQVRAASAEGRITLVGVPDAEAIIDAMPTLETVTVPAGLYAGNPKLPEEAVQTVGVTYRLMARSGLSRSLAASVTQYLFEMRTRLAQTTTTANSVRAPTYETTAEATSARLPIHPGAIDYFEREQESFIERYETWIYLVAFLGGGIGSTVAWLRQRLTRLRRETIEAATERLLEIRAEARRLTDPDELPALAEEVEDLAAEIAATALRRHAEARTMSAAVIAIDVARSTLARAAGSAPGPSAAKRSLRAVD